MNEKPQNTHSDRFYYALAIRIAGDFGVTLAIPPLIAAIIGEKLDGKWGTEPFMLIILLIVAFIVSAIFVVRKAYYYAEIYRNGSK